MHDQAVSVINQRCARSSGLTASYRLLPPPACTFHILSFLHFRPSRALPLQSFARPFASARSRSPWRARLLRARSVGRARKGQSVRPQGRRGTRHPSPNLSQPTAPWGEGPNMFLRIAQERNLFRDERPSIRFHASGRVDSQRQTLLSF